MSDAGTDGTVEVRHELDAPPGKVWRAVTVPALRARWLPDADLLGAEPVGVEPGREVSYRMREGAPPFIESTVTFHVEPGEGGRTRLRIVHRLTDPRFARAPSRVSWVDPRDPAQSDMERKQGRVGEPTRSCLGVAANGNAPLMRAA